MTWSAPAAAANRPFSGPLTVVMTVASDQRASWMAALPTAPAPPATSTTRPARAPGPSRVGPSSATVRQRWAVTNGTPRPAPRSKLAESGSVTTCERGISAYSCAVPSGRPWAASRTQTRSPTSPASTPAPTASTTPAPSWFGTCAGSTGVPGSLPRRDFQSVGLTPERWIRTRTSPGPGSVSGLSTSVSTSGSPVRVYVMARMWTPWRRRSTGRAVAAPSTLPGRGAVLPVGGCAATGRRRRIVV